jgi:D-threonate/D-erythronate kinase
VTGACDSAAPFCGAGAVEVGLWPEVPDAELSAVSTETRDFDRDQAEARTEGAARRYSGRLLYRKLDSLLRGVPLADLRGLLAAGAVRAVVAPALPAEGRTTAGGIQRWAAGAVDVRALFGPLGDRVVVRDAATDADLDRIAGEILETGAVAAGSAGLAGALARALGLPASPPATSPRCRRPLAVVGSLAAAGQADHARQAGWRVATAAPGEVPALDGADGLLVTGGETAARCLRRYGARGIRLLAEPLPRVGYGHVRGGSLEGMPVLLKAGSFGVPSTIAEGLAWLAGSPPGGDAE